MSVDNDSSSHRRSEGDGETSPIAFVDPPVSQLGPCLSMAVMFHPGIPFPEPLGGLRKQFAAQYGFTILLAESVHTALIELMQWYNIQGCCSPPVLIRCWKPSGGWASKAPAWQKPRRATLAGHGTVAITESKTGSGDFSRRSPHPVLEELAATSLRNSLHLQVAGQHRAPAAHPHSKTADRRGASPSANCDA